MNSTGKTNKPVLFLDVDGTLCPNTFGGRAPHNEYSPWEKLPSLTPDRYMPAVYFSPRLAQELEQLPVEIIFLTSWQGLVDTWGLNKALNWKVPYLELDSFGRGDRDWEKEQALWAWHQKNLDRSFIWIDDDKWIDSIAVDRISKLDVPHLLIRTNFWEGITSLHIKQMRDFCMGLEKTTGIA